MEKEPPMFAKIHKGAQLSDEKIGQGFETGEMDNFRGVRRKKFETENGHFYYVDRSLRDESEAIRVMQIYQILKEAGLPVVEFAKTIKTKVDGQTKFFLAMEDLTEDGKYDVTESSDKISQLITTSPNSVNFQEQMIRALAVMHNNNIVDFHPGLSFAIRSIPQEKDKQSVMVDFRIIDYPNLTISGLPKGWEGKFDFEEECNKNLTQLLDRVLFKDDQKLQLENLYKQIRENNEKDFKP